MVKIIYFNEDEYIGNIFKKCTHGLQFSSTDEEALFKALEDILRRLGIPKLCFSARFQGLTTFEDD